MRIGHKFVKVHIVCIAIGKSKNLTNLSFYKSLSIPRIEFVYPFDYGIAYVPVEIYQFPNRKLFNPLTTGVMFVPNEIVYIYQFPDRKLFNPLTMGSYTSQLKYMSKKLMKNNKVLKFRLSQV